MSGVAPACPRDQSYDWAQARTVQSWLKSVATIGVGVAFAGRLTCGEMAGEERQVAEQRGRGRRSAARERDVGGGATTHS